MDVQGVVRFRYGHGICLNVRFGAALPAPWARREEFFKDAAADSVLRGLVSLDPASDPVEMRAHIVICVEYLRLVDPAQKRPALLLSRLLPTQPKRLGLHTLPSASARSSCLLLTVMF